MASTSRHPPSAARTQRTGRLPTPPTKATDAVATRSGLSKHDRWYSQHVSGTFKGVAVRGVNSCPRTYEGRGGFKPHKIDRQSAAITALKRMMTPGSERASLGATALRWQLQKNKDDGYFLSCGTSVEEAYDTYPFVYSFDLSDIRYRAWSDVSPTLRDTKAVDLSYLYTDGRGIDSSNIIVVFCLRGGFNRKKEVLVMSPIAPDRCTVRVGEDFVSFSEWKKRVPEGACTCSSCQK